ncbi:MAG: phytanoyl-CoA dioxygenase family protein [Gammaproteobacteria bacterium]|nr:phytanoyl-CoA dioxygenase family protein [Gammaproteobacteria bacterium]
MSSSIVVNDTMIKAFQRDGAVLIRGLFKSQVELLRIGIEKNMQKPGPFASENFKEGHCGRFFDDYCNWPRFKEFEQAIFNSPAPRVAAQLMQSQNVQVFHDHILVKEPGTSLATPWHQDSPYYFVEGEQTISFWSPMDHVTDATLRFVAGSHKWQKPVLPIRWTTEESYFPDQDTYMPIPDPDAEDMPILEWEMQPGDAVAFNYRTLHGARANNSSLRRRAFSIRYVGDDARYIERPGRTSPPYPGHGMQTGQKLREDWFPYVYKQTT